MAITGSVFQEYNKYYPQVLLHEYVYESVGKLWKVYIVLLLIFLMTGIYFY